MDQEVATNPVADAGTPAPEAEVAEETIAQEGEEIEGQQPDDDSEELEHEGKKYRIAKDLKPLLMMQADYTRKTQEVAEQRKALEAERTTVRQQAEAERAHIKDLSRLYGMDEQLEAFSKVDWGRLWAEDFQRAGTLQGQWQALQQAREGLARELTQKEQQKAFQAQQETAKRMEEAQATLKREIPEWSPELASKLRTFAETKGGFRAEELAGVTDPRHVKILHLAYLGEQLIAKQKAAAAKPATPEAKPVPTVSARSAPASRDPDKMTTEEWVRWRDEQVRKRGGR